MCDFEFDRGNGERSFCGLWKDHEGSHYLLPEKPDFVDMVKMDSYTEKFKGLNNRVQAPDPDYPLPPMVYMDWYSRCFVTQASHVTLYRGVLCKACGRILVK
jgi:hypothetical protein